MADITPIIVGGALTLAGVIVSSGVQVFVNWRAHKHQLERELLAYKRQVVDAKRERLIREYVKASDAAQVYKSVTRRAIFMAKEDLGTLEGDVRTAFLALEQVLAALEVETNSATIIAAGNRLELAYIQYTNSVQDGTYDYAIVDTAIDSLRSAMRDSLADLEGYIVPSGFAKGSLQLSKFNRFLRSRTQTNEGETA